MGDVPRDFELDPIDPSTHPHPAPPRYLKPDIYRDPKVFELIDKHAVSVSKLCYVFHLQPNS